MTIIPPTQLRPQTLDALIEEFITRHGAVHGHSDVPLEAQIRTVHRQLQTGQALIVFDEENETCTIMPADEVHKRREAGTGRPTEPDEQ